MPTSFFSRWVPAPSDKDIKQSDSNTETHLSVYAFHQLDDWYFLELCQVWNNLQSAHQNRTFSIMMGCMWEGTQNTTSWNFAPSLRNDLDLHTFHNSKKRNVLWRCNNHDAKNRDPDKKEESAKNLLKKIVVFLLNICWSETNCFMERNKLKSRKSPLCFFQQKFLFH
jgi:hypothetical protein